MSSNPRIITATPASVLQLLSEVEHRWPVQEDTQAEDSTYQQWHTKAHEAVSYGLMTLSASFWDYTDSAEESKERRFPAEEFNELKECLERSLRSITLRGAYKIVRHPSIPRQSSQADVRASINTMFRFGNSRQSSHSPRRFVTTIWRG